MKQHLGQNQIKTIPKIRRDKFIIFCIVAYAMYLGFAFVFNAHADPPSSPFAPGATLDPGCSPTSTNCTVNPPLFSSTTLPIGGLLFVNDASGTITANTSSLYWNSASSTLLVNGTLLTSGIALSSLTSSILVTDGNGNVGALSIGSGLSLSSGTLTATGGGGGSGPLAITTSSISLVDELDSTTTQITIKNTTATGTLYSYTLPGNTLGTNGDFIRINMFGYIFNNSGSNRTVTLRLFYGGKQFFAVPSGNIAANAATSGWSATFYIANTSSSQAQVGEFNAQASPGSGTVSVTWGGGGISSVDSTVDQNVQVQASLSTASTTVWLAVTSVKTELVTGNQVIVTNVTGTVSAVTATGTDFYVPYFTDTTTLSETSSIFYASSTGFIGIGTTTPSQMLTVNGKIKAVGGFNGQCLSSGGFNATSSGSCNMDVAEVYPTFEPTEPGDVVAIPPYATGTDIVAIGRSHGTANETVIGVVSTNPGLVFNNGETSIAGENDDLTTSTQAAIALVGRVPVKISLENGPIAPGDSLAASTDLPGVAVKAIGPGRVIGEALQAFDEADAHSSNASGTPQILVFINPHWDPGTPSSSFSIGISLSQFVQTLQSALENLGITINNGIVTIKNLVVEKLTAGEVDADKICLSGTCVTQGELSAMLENHVATSSPDTAPAAAPPEDSTTTISAPVASSSIPTSTPVSDLTPIETTSTTSTASTTPASAPDPDLSTSLPPPPPPSPPPPPQQQQPPPPSETSPSSSPSTPPPPPPSSPSPSPSDASSTTN